MKVRSDHVAGGAFIVFGIIVYALSGDLPTGRLASPGAGMLPKLAAALIIFFGLVLVLRAGESELFSTIAWGDLRHTVPVVVLTAAAVAVYAWLGFIVTMTLLAFALLVGVERRNPFVAAVFSVFLVFGTYYLFRLVLKSPLEPGILAGVLRL